MATISRMSSASTNSRTDGEARSAIANRISGVTAPVKTGSGGRPGAPTKTPLAASARTAASQTASVISTACVRTGFGSSPDNVVWTAEVVIAVLLVTCILQVYVQHATIQTCTLQVTIVTGANRTIRPKPPRRSDCAIANPLDRQADKWLRP